MFQLSNQVADTFALRTLSTFKLADIYNRIPFFPSLQPDIRSVSRRTGAETRVSGAEGAGTRER